LQCEQIADIAVELLGPQMRIRLGIDQLGVDAQFAIRPPDAAFEDIAHAQLAADLLGVDCFVPISERRVARDHKAVGDARQIRRHILCDAVGKVLLVGVIAEVGERQHDDRQPWRHEGLRDRRCGRYRRRWRGFGSWPEPPSADGNDQRED